MQAVVRNWCVVSGIQINEVRISNFRCLRNVRVLLGETIVLLGENNSGKSSFIEALHSAVGAGRRELSPEDIFLGPSETVAPKDRKITIDILVRPSDKDGNKIDSFPEGSFWLDLWGNGIAQDDDDNDFLGLRTELFWNDERDDYLIERKYLKEWLDDKDKWLRAKINESAGTPSRPQIEPMSLFVMDAKRDIQEDLQFKSSFWSKLVRDLKLPSEETSRLEGVLSDLNKSVVEKSSVLSHIETELRDLQRTIVCEPKRVGIVPLPGKISDLSKGMDISFATKGAQAFPISRHGMGTRSLAAILVFRAYSSWSHKTTGVETLHPFLALEEPEAHLHPHAQRALFDLIRKIPGQRIVSTHSPYIAEHAAIPELRYFRKDGAESTVTEIDQSSLTAIDLKDIERWILKTRGDLLYARAIVLCEGPTESIALPILAEEYWQMPASALGISFVSVEGQKYLPFVRLALALNIPWYILSDGETLVVTNLQKSLAKASIDISKSKNILIRPSGEDYEAGLVCPEYKDVLIDLVVSHEGTTEEHKKKLKAEFASGADPFPKILAFMRKNKVEYALKTAQALTKFPDSKHRIPKFIRQLLDMISTDLNIKK